VIPACFEGARDSEFDSAAFQLSGRFRNKVFASLNKVEVGLLERKLRGGALA